MGDLVTLRPLKPSDASALFEALGSPAVFRFLSPGPQSTDDFKHCIAWSRRVARSKRHLVFGVVPHGATKPVGIMQIWKIEPDFSVAECGFIMGEDYWGTGMFRDGAELLLDYAFHELGVHRLEARSAVGNGRGNGALQKLGMTREACLRSCFRLSSGFTDHYMWAVLATEWRARKAA